MEAIEIIDHKGYDIHIYNDENAESPDKWENTDAFLVYDHRDFCIKRKGFDPTEILGHIQETKRRFYDGYYVFPVFAYIHSGVSLSVSHHNFPDARWDVSKSGFCLVRREKGVWPKQKALKLAEVIIEEWNQWLSGDVYGYESDISSCWGFYGALGKEQMIAEAKAEIDSVIEQKQKEIDALQYKLNF